MYAAISTGTTRTRSRLPGHRKFIWKHRSTSLRHPHRTLVRPPQLPHGRESHDRTHDVLFGGELQRIDARAAERRTEHLLSLPDDGGEARAELPVVRVDPHVLARLG